MLIKRGGNIKKKCIFAAEIQTLFEKVAEVVEW